MSYDLRGGPTRRPVAEPLLAINGQGGMLFAFTADGDVRQAKMAAGELQVLLDEIVTTHRFFDIDSEAIKVRIEEERVRSGRLFVIADAGVTSIRVRLADRQKQVDFYGLSMAAQIFPDIEALQRLYAIEQRLQRELERLRTAE